VVNKVGNYFFTLRHLKIQQILGRLRLYVFRCKPDDSLAPPLRLVLSNFKPWVERAPSMVGKGDFCFLNQNGSLALSGWNDFPYTSPNQTPTKLWRYNQHYFDDLNAADAGLRKGWHYDLLKRWIEDNPPAVGVGWDPYPTSLRIVNWIKWHHKGNLLPDACLQSLAVQARWLACRIEWHLLGNHLFANAKALVFVGLFFSGEEASRWLRTGLKIIAHELPEQVLSDGGNFERSPMYHAIFLEDLLDLINLSLVFPGFISEEQTAVWRETAERMLTWLDVMVHPDGDIGFFNDAALGIAPTPRDLVAYAERLPVNYSSGGLNRVNHLVESGYVRLVAKNATALLDVAPIGPDYLPGHAHADTLSFELSLFGQRVFVNGGTSEYEIGDVRQYERSTQAHNTVVINDLNSSEVWAGFRVARRAYPQDLIITEVKDSVLISCAHNGYSRLRGNPVHRRTCRFSETAMLVEDRIEGSCEDAAAYFHLHPSVDVEPISKNRWNLRMYTGGRIVFYVEQGVGELANSYYAPEFGQRLEAPCIKVTLSNQCSCVHISWGEPN
jgi:uncharacterized heparinase superfamily protein